MQHPVIAVTSEWTVGTLKPGISTGFTLLAPVVNHNIHLLQLPTSGLMSLCRIRLPCR
jgi:hypothetical protein